MWICKSLARTGSSIRWLPRCNQIMEGNKKDVPIEMMIFSFWCHFIRWLFWVVTSHDLTQKGSTKCMPISSKWRSWSSELLFGVGEKKSFTTANSIPKPVARGCINLNKRFIHNTQSFSNQITSIHILYDIIIIIILIANIFEFSSAFFFTLTKLMLNCHKLTWVRSGSSIRNSSKWIFGKCDE